MNWRDRQYVSKPVEQGMKTLFVGSLPPESTPALLEEYFSSFGGAVKVKLIFDWTTHRSKQCALIFCPDITTAENLLSVAHDMGGRKVRLQWADAEKRGTKKIETNVLFVGNFPEALTDGDLTNYFNRFGQVVHVKFFRNQSTRASCKNAFIKFAEFESIERVLESRHQHRIQGKVLKVAMFKPNTKACPSDNLRKSPLPDDAEHKASVLFPEPYESEEASYEEGSDEKSQKSHPGATDKSTYCSEKEHESASISPCQSPPATSSLFQPRSKYLYAVEYEQDDLFRVFYSSPPPVPSPSFPFAPRPVPSKHLKQGSLRMLTQFKLF